MTTRLSRSTVFAAPFVALGLMAGGAIAQTDAPSPTVSLGYTASPFGGQSYAVAPQRPHTVMGAPGGIEWNASERTGSVTERPDQAPRAGRR